MSQSLDKKRPQSAKSTTGRIQHFAKPTPFKQSLHVQSRGNVAMQTPPPPAIIGGWLPPPDAKEFKKFLPVSIYDKQFIWDSEKLREEKIGLSEQQQNLTQQNRELRESIALLQVCPIAIKMIAHKSYFPPLSQSIYLKEQIEECKAKIEDAAMNIALPQSRQGLLIRPSSAKAGQDNTVALSSLKKQYKEAKLELRFQAQEIDKMKHSTKYMKKLEAEIEIKAYADECIRLSHLNEQVSAAQHSVEMEEEDYAFLEQKFRARNEELAILRRRKQDIFHHLRNTDEDNVSMQQRLAQLDGTQEFELQQYQHRCEDKQLEIEELQAQLAGVTANRRQREERELRARRAGQDEIAALKQESLHLQDNIQEQYTATIEIDKKLKDAAARQQEQLSQMRGKLKKLQHTLENVRIVQEKYIEKKPLSSNSSSRVGFESNRFDVSEKMKLLNELKSSSIQQAQQIDFPSVQYADQKKAYRKKVEIVQMEHIKWIGEELNYRLMANGVSWADVQELLFTKLDATSSIADMKRMLMKFPFQLQIEDNAELVARYLCESNDGNEYKYFYDDTVRNENRVIRSILKTVIGPVKLFSRKEIVQMHPNVHREIRTWREGFEKQFNIKEQEGKPKNKEEFMNACKWLEIEFQKAEIDYIIMSIILHSQSLRNLNYTLMLDYFCENVNVEDILNQASDHESEQYGDEDAIYKLQVL